tara:strand:- start:435 stop:1625 length:1191 start_codon:yes stop_codon:yes gene_type:complete
MKNSENKISFKNTEIAFRHYSDGELSKSYKIFKLLGNDLLNDLGISLTQFALAIHLPIGPIVKPLIFTSFCGGETFEECKKTVSKLAERGVFVSLNYGVEAEHNTDGIKHTMDINTQAIQFAGKNETVKVISSKPSAFGLYVLLEKKQKGLAFTEKEQVKFNDLVEIMDLICKVAAENKTKIYWDSEESWVQEAINEIVDDLMEKYNKESVIVYNTFQMYVHYKMAYLEKSITRANEKGYLLGAKVVRGAYMEKEREVAKKEGRESPIHKNKKATDKDYDKAIKLCLNNVDLVSTCVASHNEKSNKKAVELLAIFAIPKNHKHVWFYQLYGMGDHITFNLAEYGVNAGKYLPFGPVKKVIPYLIRRAEENSSMDGQMGRELGMLKKERKRRKKSAK